MTKFSYFANHAIAFSQHAKKSIGMSPFLARVAAILAAWRRISREMPLLRMKCNKVSPAYPSG
jgi:hypothetical protein